MKQRLEHNTRQEIIFYHLGNYETQITYDLEPAVNACKEYGITKEEVAKYWPEYMKLCVDNDWF